MSNLYQNLIKYTVQVYSVSFTVKLWTYGQQSHLRRRKAKWDLVKEKEITRERSLSRSVAFLYKKERREERTKDRQKDRNIKINVDSERERDRKMEEQKYIKRAKILVMVLLNTAQSNYGAMLT
jgi:hypothetical protein